MNTLRPIFLFLLSLNLFAASNLSKLEIDKSKTVVKWTGTKKLGDSHWGHIKVKKGTVSMDKKSLKGAEVIIDMSSIDCKDTDGTDKDAKIEGHLKNADFFDVTNKKKGGHEASLKITNIVPAKNGKYNVTANLKILEQTHPVQFETQMSPLKDGTYKAVAKFSFDRTKYGIKYKSKNVLKNAADNFINDKIDLEINLVTKK